MLVVTGNFIVIKMLLIGRRQEVCEGEETEL